MTEGERNRRALLDDVCRRHSVGLLYVFGSHAADGVRLLDGRVDEVGTDDPLADLDVGVVTRGPLPEGAGRAVLYADLYNELEEIFRPLRLDLVLLQENHSVFQAEAFKGLCVYQESPEARFTYEERILTRAADFRPFLDAFHRDLLEDV